MKCLSGESKKVIISGKEPSIIVQNVKNGTDDYGYDAHKEVYGNLFSLGIIDPKKVTRVALENSASVAGLFLTTECVVSEVKIKDDNINLPPL